MRRRFAFLIISLIIISFGCEKEAPAPGAATLVSPANNEPCTTGIILSDTESKIYLSWNAAVNAESYEITLTNLLDKAQKIQVSSTTNIELTLKRNTPYSWYVTSKSSKSPVTTKSSIWKFYNPGLGTSSFPPYPAEIISPTLGQTISPNGGKITLQWKGTDADNDIQNYDVYMGINSNVAIIKSQNTTTSLADVSVNANTTYYWKVISRDGKANTSDSGLYEFKTN
jgi:hypothetical protein